MKVFVYSARAYDQPVLQAAAGNHELVFTEKRLGSETVHYADGCITSLDSGRLGAACLDVYEFEKGLFFEDHSNDIIHNMTFVLLRNFKNVLMTSHQGFLTSDAIDQIAEAPIGNLNCFQNGLLCRNELKVDVDLKPKNSNQNYSLDLVTSTQTPKT